MRSLRFVTLAVLLSGAAHPQSSEPQPAFEVADVHSAPPSAIRFGREGTLHGSRYEYKGATMVDLISSAYGVDSDKVIGGPTWLEMDRFDVIAKVPAGTAPETLNLMLRSLLADRFKLVAHADTKSLPAYALRVGKHLLLKQAEGTEETGCKQSLKGLPNGPTDGPIQISSITITMSCHNATVASFLDRIPIPRQAPGGGTKPIVDQTGLKGTWNFDFNYSLGAAADNILTVSNQLEQQLGLKLDSVMIPLPVVQVQSANQTPTPNSPEVEKAFPPLPTQFDVAEIKPSQAGASNAPIMLNGGTVMVARAAGRAGGRGPAIQNGRVNLQGYTLKNLVKLAWNITSDDKIAGLPKFADSDKYDVIAKVPSGSADAFSDMDSIRPLLRALLIERFKMEVHTEDRPVPTFVLSAVKPKLQKADTTARTRFYEGPAPDAKDPRGSNPAVARMVTCENMTMSQFALLLNGIAGGYIQNQPVLNETGLDGAWDFSLSFSGAGMVGGGRAGAMVFRVGGGGGDGGPAGAASDPSGGISLNDALSKQLGLKLDTQKRPAPVVVVDHIEQKPIDN